MILSGRVAFLDCAQAPQHPKVPNWERERFDRGLRFRAILQAMSDGISSEIRRLFDDLLQIGNSACCHIEGASCRSTACPFADH